jgi:hypothetical protein
MEEKRRIPYGVINWAQLVRECFVVDNTRYVRELGSVQTPVFLRPKRFGKSVVCSMLAHYYDELSEVTNVDEARTAFGDAVEVCGNTGYNWFDLQT